MPFLNTPFIPQKKVTKVIIAGDCSDIIISQLQKNNINIIKTLKNPQISGSMSYHADLQVAVVKQTIVVADFAYEYYKAALPEFNVVKGCSAVQDTYPNDIAYNVSAVGKTMFHNLKYTDKIVTEAFLNECYGIQNVRQGYTKCTTCIVSDNAVITEDNGIAQAFENFGIDVLKISCGDVSLSGYDYGFLGGASGLIDKNKLCFCGDITKHSDFDKIFKFTQRHEVDIISLSDRNLTDYGSIIPILV